MGFVVIIVLLIVKLQRSKKEYHSEIKDHHEKVERELKLNLTGIRQLYQNNRCLGNIKGLSKKIVEKPKFTKKKTKDGHETELTLEREEFFIFSLAQKGFWIFRFGSEHLIIPANLIRFDWGRKRALLSNDVSLEYFMGYFLPTEQKAKVFTHSEFYRTLMDKSIDGMGTQMLKFSEVKDEWAHAMAMKDKEIERIKEEKKLMGTRAR